MTPQILHTPVETYLARLAVKGNLPPVFERMHAEASRRNFPIVGPEVGRLFQQIATLSRPSRILELGSGFGYSAVWWALGAPNAEIHLTDFSEENLKQARVFADEAGVASRMHFHCGDALALARDLAGPWDIIFCDIDKAMYPAALDFAEKVIAHGGLLVYDNMLWYGRVAMPDPDAETRAVIEVSERLYNDPQWLPSLMPVRDGVLLALRKGPQ